MKNLEHFAKDISALVLWTDCDREGEAIGFDIVDVVLRAARKQNVDILRAHFSAMTF